MTRRTRAIVFAAALSIFVTPILSSESASAEGIKLRVTAEQANIREQPDIVSAILRQFPEGATLTAERKEGDWYAVLVENDSGGLVLGYVHESLVMVVEEVPLEKLQQEKPVVVQEPDVVRPVEEKTEEPRPLPPRTYPSPAAGEGREKTGVVLWGGGRQAAVGDLNDGAAGLAHYYEFRLAAAGDRDVEALHFGYLFGAEVRLPLIWGFFLSVGAEHTSGEAASLVTFEDGTSGAIYSATPRLETTPISLALLYYPARRVYLKAGLEYSFVRCSYSYRVSQRDPAGTAESWQEWTGRATSSGLGYQFGLGLGWPLGSRVSLIAEVAFRHGRLTDLDGEDTYLDSSNVRSTEEGTLYRTLAAPDGEELFPDGPGTFPMVFIRGRLPAGAVAIDVRRAEVDLTGYSLKLGLEIRL